jgi:ATP-binding cassette, subfamily B, bacterial
MIDVSAVCWPASRAAEGLELLARAAALPIRADHTPHTPQASIDLGNQLPTTANSLGLEVESVDSSFGEMNTLLRSAAPAVIRMRDETLVMLVKRRGRTVRVVRPDHRMVSIPIEALRGAFVEAEAKLVAGEIERLVEDSGVGPSRRASVVRALVEERLCSRRLRAGWLVRIPPGGSFRAQLTAIGARRQLLLLAAAHGGQYALLIAAWWLLGRAALQGRLDATWLSAWTLTVASIVPLQLAALWVQGKLAIDIGAVLKQRLLTGAFRLEPEETRREGAGHLLGRVIEAEAVESLALGGGFTALLASLELALAAGVLALATPVLTVLLLVWTGLAGSLAAVFFARRLAWTRQRLELTFDLIERMVGHRTRIAQQPREQWHDGEDDIIERYVHSSAAMDRAAVSLLAFVPRGWMIVGLCGLTPLFGAGTATVSLAIGVGGILLAFRALDRLTGGLWNLAGAAIAWRQTAPVFRAAARATAEPAALARPGSAAASGVLDATDLRFSHAGRGEPVLRGCSLTIAPGERVILHGASGGGKSTLASLLAGLRTPQSGLLLFDGLDRHTLGLAEWRRRVVLVPQFHENHLVLGSVAFNLLMAGEWPPGEGDFARAEEVLRELGLGETLDRMPSGLLQTIGETGWQLSHGERSRIYLARALLQKPDVLILDESFAQLDPENMRRALETVIARAPAVLLIAHH